MKKLISFLLLLCITGGIHATPEPSPIFKRWAKTRMERRSQSQPAMMTPTKEVTPQETLIEDIQETPIQTPKNSPVQALHILCPRCLEIVSPADEETHASLSYEAQHAALANLLEEHSCS